MSVQNSILDCSVTMIREATFTLGEEMLQVSGWRTKPVQWQGVIHF